MIAFNKQKVEKEAQIILNNYKAGNFSIAEIKAKQLVKKYPTYAVIHNILALSLSEQGKLNEAIKTFKKIIQIRPDFVLAYNNLGNMYVKLGEQENAMKYFNEALKIQPKLAFAHNNLGNLFKDLKKFDEAIISFKKAIEFQPQMFVSYSNLGVLYQNLGRFKESAEILNKAIEINPNFAAAHNYLSQITKYTEGHTHLKQMKKIILNPKSKLEDKMYLSFGIGKAYEDIKNNKKAFEFYKNANAFKRKLIKYSIETDIELFQKIKETFNQNIFDNFKKTGCNNKTPIFILGMPRSGTTLVEQIISTHPKVFGADEIKNFDNAVKKYFYSNDRYIFPKNLTNVDKSIFDEIGNKYIKSIRKYNDICEHISDKALLNFRWIGLIKLALPNAKIIHCVRDPRDNCFSIFKNNFAGRLDFSYDLKELVEYYNLYQNLMQHWHKVLPGFIYDISYETLIQKQEKETRKLLEICDLEWNEKCLQFYKNSRAIETASITQVRQPIYKSSMKSWKKCETQLESAFESLSRESILLK